MNTLNTDTKQFAAGDWIQFDIDHPEWGRLASEGKILQVRGDKLLVEARAIRANIIVPTAEAQLLCQTCGPRAAGGYFYSGHAGVLAHVQKGTFVTAQRCEDCQRYASDQQAEQALLAAGLTKIAPQDLAPVVLSGISIRNIRWTDPREDCLWGTCEILGVPHHVQFLRVHEVNDEADGSIQQPTKDPHDRYGDLRALYPAADSFCSVDLSPLGFEGRWVVLIHPYED